MRSTPHRATGDDNIRLKSHGLHADPRARQADRSPKKRKHPRVDAEGAGQSPRTTTRGYLRVGSPPGWARMKRWATRSGGLVVVVVAHIRNALRWIQEQRWTRVRLRLHKLQLRPKQNFFVEQALLSFSRLTMGPYFISTTSRLQ